ncbi:MAG: TonB-dependent receptor [Chitinophagaceae bacterium]|nr:TonB-dependent receptor [Chitinophagaceae bacterium]
MKVSSLRSLKNQITRRSGLLPGSLLFLLPLWLIILAALPSMAQTTIRVKGAVTNETGQPVQRPSVVIKGSSVGVTGDDNGNFEISAPGDATLVISAIDFLQREVKVNNRQTLSITLSPQDRSLDEVVVVGYGTQKSKDVTGAVVKIKGETLREVAAPNVIAQLKGRTAGVDIVSNSATPGGGGQIRIRGTRSIARTQGEADGLDNPLIVLDGIPFSGSINDINPDDIASLEILKDASATAIYGSRGSGGVILITTKRGKTGKGVISYDTYNGISRIMDKLRVFNGPEFAAFKAEAAAGAAPASSGYLLTTSEQAALAAGISTDWQDLMYKDGFVTNHNLSLAGGTEGTQFGLSGGYFKETGIIPNQKFERYSLRATIDHQLNSRIRIGINTLNTLTFARAPGGGGVPGGLMRLTPLAEPYNADGTVNLFPQQGADASISVSPLTLISKPEQILDRTRRIRTFNSLYGEVMIIKGLKYRINIGLDYRQQQQDNYEGILTSVNPSTNPTQNRASVRNGEAWTYTIDNLVNYDFTVNDKHRVGFTGLFGVQKDHSQNTGLFGVGLPADYQQNTNIGLAQTVAAINPQNPNDNPNNFSKRGLISYMARATYGYDNRYNLTATVRRDGASVLSPGNQWFTYPAFAVGWNVSNERFMQGVAFLSNLKLRGGWGKTSNQGVAPYSTLGGLGTSFYNFGQGTAGQQIAFLVTTLPNSSLKWQSTQQTNIGLEFGLFRNRITGVIDVYSHKTKDILLPVSLPFSNGATSTVQNVGKTKGHGLEITLSTVNIKTASGLVWSTDLNYFFSRDEITQLATPSQLSNIDNGWFVGQPLNVIYDLRKIGIWQTKDAAELAAQISPVQKAGQIRVEDLNGDHKIDANDRQIIGSFQPKWEGGLTNRVTFKNFDLSVVMYARMGMKVLVPYVTTDGSGQGYTFFMQSRNNQLKVDYWTPTNPTNAFPRPDASTDRFLYASTVGYMDGSFIKCRSINLGYDFPKSWMNKAHLQSLRLYVSAVNPFILYSPFVRDGFGPDPEGNGYGGGIQSQQGGNSVGAGGSGGVGRIISVNANNPSTRQFLIGLNLKF